ncbi:MAG: hypothetical protein QNK23_11980 [Crocinitomicaceae bacterium]|nr:hypothetical protein [Crocinitomicaceae bacterium]
MPLSILAQEVDYQDTVYVKCPGDSEYSAYFLDSTWTYESIEEINLITRADCKYFKGSMVDNQPWKGRMYDFYEENLLLFIHHWEDGKSKSDSCQCPD